MQTIIQIYIEGTDIEDMQGAIVYAIYEYLSAEANTWLYEQQEKQKVA